MRFDDTNPVKEDIEYVNSIKEDVKWLGFDWEELRFASDYFEEMYNRAVLLIKKGKAYVDDQSADQIRETRGTLTEPGKNSPYRDRSVEENLDLFERMRKGNSPTANACCAPRSIWPPRISICGIRSSTGSPTRIITIQATSGASIRCMLLPIRWRMPSKGLRIPVLPGV